MESELNISVPAAYLARYQGAERVESFDSRMTRCYELALRAQLNFAHLGWATTLVHGTIGPAHNPHAWIEWRDDAGRRWCWDGIFDGIMPGALFVIEMYAVEWTRYTPKEAATWAARDVGNGPWGKRDIERAILAISAMVAAGHDVEGGAARIEEILADNKMKGNGNASSPRL